MRNPIRFQNVVVGAIVIFIVFKAWWNGMFINFLLATGNSDVVSNTTIPLTSLSNTIFGTLLFLALDAVDFVGKITITAIKFIYAVIKDVVMGTKSLTDLLKQEDEPVHVQVTSVSVDAEVTHNQQTTHAPVEPAKRVYSDREIIMATYNNTKTLNTKINSVQTELSEVKTRMNVLEENQ
jgi:hypothetical protein